MTPGHDQRVRDLFEAAIDLPVADRAGLIASITGNTTRIEVQQLLNAHDQSEGFLEPMREAIPPLSTDGTRIGRYTITRLLGAGGMGAVYEALQDNPRRTVALKLLRAPFTGSAARRRFDHESQVLALLQHPSIAQIYEAGAHHDATPYFAMEFIPGARTIVEYANARALCVRDKLALFVRVCDAVQFAHLRGVIHRDLKPGNILINESGDPKVIDFGIARLADADITAATLETGIGQLVGTLRYMSPEQCAGDPRQIDTRTDVYTLGVVLYELLTGRMPYELGTTSIAQAPRIIREQPPLRPSAVFTALRGDVETIVLKALAKDRPDRYQSAGELAADIRRFLANEPILASRAGILTSLRLLARRHRAAVTAASITLVALTVGLVLALWQANRATRAAAEARRQSYISDIAAAQAAFASDDGPALRRFLDRADLDLRGWEWNYLNVLADTSTERIAFDAPVAGIGIAASNALVILTNDGRLLLRDSSATSGFNELTRVPSSEPCLTMNAGRTRAAIASNDGTVEIWDLIARRRLHTLRFDPTPGYKLAISPDDRYLALGCDDGGVFCWDLQHPESSRRLDARSGRASAVAFSSDSTRLVIASWNSYAGVYDVHSWSQAVTYPLPAATNNVRFTPDARELIVATIDGRLLFCDALTGALRRVIHAHASEILDIDLSPDASTLLTTSADSTVKLWDIPTGALRARFHGHADAVHIACFGATASVVASADSDAVVRTWNAVLDAEAPPAFAGPEWAESIAYSRDGLRLCAAETGAVHVFNTREPSQRLSVPISKGRIVCAGFNADGSLIAARGGSGEVVVVDPRTAASVASIPSSIAFNDSARGGLAWIGDQSLLADATPGAPVRIIDARDGTVLRSLGPDAAWVGVAAGRSIIAATSYDGRIFLWSARDHRLLAEHQFSSQLSRAIALSRDERTLAVGTMDGDILLIDPRTARQRRTLHAHPTRISTLAFNPDGTRLASGGGWDHTVRLWDPASGDELLSLRADNVWAITVAFSPDADHLAVAPSSVGVRIFSANVGMRPESLRVQHTLPN